MSTPTTITATILVNACSAEGTSNQKKASLAARFSIPGQIVGYLRKKQRTIIRYREWIFCIRIKLKFLIKTMGETTETRR
jgi:hypothetical protein